MRNHIILTLYEQSYHFHFLFFDKSYHFHYSITNHITFTFTAKTIANNHYRCFSAGHRSAKQRWQRGAAWTKSCRTWHHTFLGRKYLWNQIHVLIVLCYLIYKLLLFLSMAPRSLDSSFFFMRTPLPAVKKSFSKT